ncbi:DUF1289 domain-containing protein [Aurantimonas sp. 22II-16-19i]|uniref:DUF1289 domain-containing protein n=1 Tax=Aurantimonas sp. 22II-16-19i TaxID=1317114 RepID=UPI0009F7A562|nr:DUF1289 domain-containing protein [Aurantimonas sp. 22II-16-19i]ORE94961.1 hypothetical protein ATO4_12750 [Aurantimonas sp. 22II-16-19i]
MAIESPCTQICTIDRSSGLCLGCARSIEEIAGWASFSAEGRRTIMTELEARRQAMAAPAQQPGSGSDRQDQRPGSAVFANAS